MKYYCSDKCLNKNYLIQNKNPVINNKSEVRNTKEDTDSDKEYDPMYDF